MFLTALRLKAEATSIDGVERVNVRDQI